MKKDFNQVSKSMVDRALANLEAKSNKSTSKKPGKKARNIKKAGNS